MRSLLHCIVRCYEKLQQTNHNVQQQKNQEYKTIQPNEVWAYIVIQLTYSVWFAFTFHILITNSNNDNNFRVDLHFYSSFDPLKMFIWSWAVADECVAKHIYTNSWIGASQCTEHEDLMDLINSNRRSIILWTKQPNEKKTVLLSRWLKCYRPKTAHLRALKCVHIDL